MSFSISDILSPIQFIMQFSTKTTASKMNKFEKHLDNLDVVDKHGVKDVIVTNSLVCNGYVKSIIKKSDEIKAKRRRSLAAAVVGLNNTAAPLSDGQFYDPKVYIDAQEMYLRMDPTCYLILSKPGPGAFSLAEAIAKKLNCIHLCPENIIRDEIDQKSSTGTCLHYNLNQKKFCGFDIFLKILKVKLDSPAVKHRGYVISGFPLVMANASPKYLINSFHGEGSLLIVQELLLDLICNLKKNKHKKKRTEKGSFPSITSDNELPEEYEEEAEEEQEPEELLEEEEDVKCDLPKFLLNICSDIIAPEHAYYKTRKAVLLEQINTLFNLEMKPRIIIYLTIPDKDMIKKKGNEYINYMNSTITTESFLNSVQTDLRWPGKYKISQNTSRYDTHTFNPKYCCRQPFDFEEKSINQMCNYRNDILPYVEAKVTEFKPNFIIKLDARQTVYQMMQHVMERLLLLPIKPIIIPEPLYMEEPPDDMEEFWKSVEEQNVLRSGELSFKRYASPWFNRCPVELKNRQSKRGNSKLAVIYSRHVYLLSTLDAMVSFCRTPRPYLKLKYLEPTCRIIVMGTKLSGKTMISECLSWLFDTPIISYNTFLECERDKKYNNFAKTILSEIIATIEDKRFAAWQQAELERFAKLDKWCKQTLVKLQSYIPLLVESFRYLKSKPTEIRVPSSVESLASHENVVEEFKLEEPLIPSSEFLEAFASIRTELGFLPNLDDLDLCQRILIDKAVDLYAPGELRDTVPKPAIPILGDEDVTTAVQDYILANELQNEMEPTTEEIMTEMVAKLTKIDTDWTSATNSDQMYGKYIIDGFPSNTECWSFLSESKIMPDYTIALIENREIDDDLIEDYKVINRSPKYYNEQFMAANDPLITATLVSKPKPPSAILYLEEILSNVFNSRQVNADTVNSEGDPESYTFASFTEDVDRFKEDWDTVILKVEEHNKCYIGVELENKSDVQVVEEVLLKLRQSYMTTCESYEEDSGDEEDEDEAAKDLLTFNDPRNLCDTNIYCPIAYYDHGVLWEGKPEFGIIHDNKCYYFCKEDALETFKKDITKYQSFNKPYKHLPPCRICVIGCIGSGKTTLSKLLAKELGFVHIDFADVINGLLMPRHFKKVGLRYENSFTDIPIDDEAVTEFQMDEDNENLVSDILSDETELRRMVYNYFERGTPIISPLMEKLIKKLWFQDPFLNTGFILDGYPRLPSDVEDMVNCFCIPDLVLELEGSSEVTQHRLGNKMFEKWKDQLQDAKEKVKEKLDIERQEWMNFITKNVVSKLIIDEALENVFMSTLEPIQEMPPSDSVIIDAHPSGSANVDAKLFNYYNQMIREFPAPADQSEWEKADDARERIESRIESIYESDDENIQGLKDILSEQRIKTCPIDGSKSIDKVLRITLSKLTNLRSRCESFFEQTSIVNTDIAELLLLEGFRFLSKFYRTCPVYVYENPNAIQSTYKLSRPKDKIYPIIHRSYIYFLDGPDAVKNFRRNPLKYIFSAKIAKFIEYPLRIGVIGPPKSGKSSLAAKLANRYGLICISKGKAIRNIIENMNWTELSSKMQVTIDSGDCIDEDHIIKAIQTAAIDHRTITYGYVLDGFPETASEAMELCKDGLYPNIVFDIRSNVGTVLESSQHEVYYDILKYKPPYPKPFVQNRYETWSVNTYKIRDWINSDYQNIYVLDGNQSLWKCLDDAIKVVNEFIPKVHNYLTEVETSIVRADIMCISNEMFNQRISCYKHMCPLCLNKNVLKHSDYPINKKGVVQFRNIDMNIVLKDPYKHLAEEVEIPEIPAVVKTVHMDLVYENGICIVHYATKLPAQILVRGNSKHAASFKKKTYLFCSEKCLETFLATPHIYFDITVFKNKKVFPPLVLNKLPNLGYLEQTVGGLLTDACCAVNVFRPKYPGLDFRTSALLHIALYLKTHNPRIDRTILPKYTKASDVFDARCKLISRVGLLLRSMDNPFASYPVCCGHSKSGDSRTVTQSSSIFSSSRSELCYKND